MKSSNRTMAQQHSEIVKLMMDGDRHKPQHMRATSRGVGGSITAAHKLMFDLFNWFGPALNQHVSQPWAAEELANTLVRDPWSDSPEFGRRYRIWYNAAELGMVQVIVAGTDWFHHPDRYREHPEAEAIVSLSWMRFVPYDDALSFIAGISRLMGRVVDQERFQENAEMAATAAMTRYLWETMLAEGEYIPDFYWRARGPFEGLRLTTAHWAESGIDPFIKWAGDRSWHGQEE
jgi:hypothetical protein